MSPQIKGILQSTGMTLEDKKKTAFIQTPHIKNLSLDNKILKLLGL